LNASKDPQSNVMNHLQVSSAWKSILNLSYQIVVISKLLTNYDLIFRSVELYGNILLLFNMPHKAIEAFELLRNVSEEFDQNMLIL